jgi:outer membrane lipoprotein LolB
MLNGAMSITAQNHTHNMHFTWLQYPDRYHIVIQGPFNTYHLLLQGNAEQATLCSDQTHCLRSSSAESLMQQSLGWSVPIIALKEWLQGQPSSLGITTHIIRNSTGKIISFEQYGWRVEYKEYGIHLSRNQPVPLEAKIAIQTINK